MACDIDPDLPKVGIPRLNKAAYERNFGAAKFCIEDLQVRVDALEAGGGGAGVVTFEGRTGVVVSQSGDYDAAEISSLGPFATATVVSAQALLADPAGRELFQGNFASPPDVLTPGRALTDADYLRVIDLTPTTGDVTVTLPDATTLTKPALPIDRSMPWCWLRVTSEANLAIVTTAVTNELRSENGYSGHNDLADTIYIGLSQAGQRSIIIPVYLITNQWNIQGLLRDTAGANLTLGIETQDEGGQILAETKAYNFVGAGVDATDGGSGVATVTIPGGGGGGTPLSTEDEGIEVEADTQIVNYTGTGVTASSAGGNQVTISIPGIAPGGSNGLYASAIVPATADLAGLNGAIAATSAAQNVIFCDSAAGTYNLAGANLNLINKAFPIYIIGDGRTVFDGGIANPARGTRKFDVRSSVSWQGINWGDFNEICTFGDMTSLIELVEVIECTFDNTAAMLQYGSGQGFDPSAAFGTIRVHRCKATNNANDFVRLQLGAGAGTRIPVQLFECVGNVLDGVDRMGLGAFYDSPSANSVYPQNGVAIFRGNVHKNQLSTETDAFCVTGSACESVIETGNYYFNNRRAAGGGQESSYHKSPYVIITDNQYYNSGESQGCLALKGQPGSEGSIGKQSVVANNQFYCDVAATFEAAIWIQRGDVLISNNLIFGPFDFGINGQTNDVYDRVTVKDNQFRMTGTTVVNAIHRGGQGLDNTIENNQVYMNNTNAAVAIRIDTGGAGVIDQPTVRNNKIVKRNGGAIDGVAITENGGDTMTDCIVSKNYFHGFAAGDSFVTFAGTIGGTIRVRDNEHTGTTPTTPIALGGNTVDATNNTF